MAIEYTYCIIRAKVRNVSLLLRFKVIVITTKASIQLQCDLKFSEKCYGHRVRIEAEIKKLTCAGNDTFNPLHCDFSFALQQ